MNDQIRIKVLEEELDAAQRDYDNEMAMVDRIWEMFGNPMYEKLELSGQSIYDLIASAQKDAERYRWLRTAGAWESEIGMDELSKTPEKFDAAVDKAMEGK